MEDLSELGQASRAIDSRSAVPSMIECIRPCDGADRLVPWHAAQSPHGAAELAREVCSGHPLWQVSVRVLARRQDCDEVLFALEDGTGRVAVVQLTRQTERDPRWPAVEIFRDIDDFCRRRMRTDHDAFVE